VFSALDGALSSRAQWYLTLAHPQVQGPSFLRLSLAAMPPAESIAARSFPTIKHVRTFITQGPGSGGDYHNVHGGHWLIDSKISTPMSQYEQYRKSRTSWGINVLGSFCVELEATDGTKGFATGFGGPPACWLVAEHFERFLVGSGRLRYSSQTD
jgi:hypothetical protein